MALNVTFNTPATDEAGRPVLSAHIRIWVEIQDDESKIVVRHAIYYDEAAYLNDKRPMILNEIPEFLTYVEADLTPVQYANVDMLNVHNQLKGFIEDGENHPNWPFFGMEPPYPQFTGIKAIDPLNAVAVVMPA